MNFLFNSRLGLGTNRIGLNPAQDLMALNYALDIGYRLIDTAERYMDHASEQIIGQCLKEQHIVSRENIQIITKVQPQNDVFESCIGSLRRLQTDYIDFFLLHWKGDANLEKVITEMLELQSKGYIKHFGVSNFNKTELIEWQTIERRLAGKSLLSANQIKYNFNDRTAAQELIPFHQANNITTIAHSPLDKGKVMLNSELISYAEQSGFSVAQSALSWILDTPGTIVIPKSSNLDRIKENLLIASRYNH